MPVATSPALALQLWTVRDALRADYDGTLDATAAMGYDGVELVDGLGYGTHGPAALRRRLDGLDLRAAGVHAGLDAVEAELPRLLDACGELRAGHLVCAFAPEVRRRDAAGYAEIARSLEAIGGRAVAAGLRFAYHHHDFELQSLDGRRGIDLLLDGTSAEAVELELDTYWMHRGGEDPVAALRRLGERCRLVHVKDARTDRGGVPERVGRTDLVADVGAGILDMAGVVAAARANAHWLIVEHDEPRDPLGSARTGLENLRRIVAGAATG